MEMGIREISPLKSSWFTLLNFPHLSNLVSPLTSYLLFNSRIYVVTFGVALSPFCLFSLDPIQNVPACPVSASGSNILKLIF
jgi:hypothetical protein